jgi:hypothetical protein
MSPEVLQIGLDQRTGEHRNFLTKVDGEEAANLLQEMIGGFHVIVEKLHDFSPGLG